MPRGRDEAGNIWELDASGNPVRMLQPATNSFAGSIPGAFVPPNPAKLAEHQRDQSRQDAADRRAEQSSTLAAQAAAREQQRFEREDTSVPPPGDVTKTGEEYLATLPPGLAAQVRAVSEGRRALPTSGRISPSMQQLVAAANQFDPTLDAANAATRVATRKKFTSGTTRDNITAINTALGHLGTLWQDAQKLNNFGSPLVNAPVNAFESGVLGDQRYTNFNLTRHAVVDELEKAFRGSGGTQAGIDEWQKGINSSQSPEQLRGAIGKAVELLDSRLQALGDAYATGMGRSSDPMVFLNPHAKAVFSALGPGGDGNVPALPKNFGGAPPILGGSDTPPPPPQGPPAVGPSLPGGVPRADYSSMVGDAQQGVATGGLRRVPDTIGAAALSAFIRKGAPYETAAAYAQSHGFNPPPPDAYAAAVAFQKANPNATPNVEADRLAQTTMGERISASPLATAFAGGVSGATAGLSDVAGRAAAGPQWDANRQAMAALNPGSDIAGNLVGGTAGVLGGGAALSRLAPGALGLGNRVFGRFAPMAGDAAYGGIYGANESPDDPVRGGMLGAMAGAGGGMVGRGATRGLANVIAPPAGAFGPTYAQGVFPTVGQRFGRSGLPGRVINTAEQALQSFPGLGAMVSRARQIPRDQFQVGAFNEALGDINQRLPAGMAPGTEPHAFATDAFRNAYTQARQGMQFVPDPQYQADTQALAGRISNGVLNPQQAQQVSDVIRNSVTGRLHTTGGVLDGAGYQQAGTELGDAIAAWGKDGTTQPMAAALRDYQTIFDNAARRNSNPAAVQMLDQADRGYAKLVRIQDAAARVGGDSGTFTPKGFDRAVQKTAGGVRSGPFLRGDALMQGYADAGRGLTDTLPNSGSAERLLTGQAVAGTGGFAMGAPAAIAAHPMSLAPFLAYAPGVNSLISRAIAPRSATLAPDVATALERIAAQIHDRSALGGRLAVPGALALELNR